MKFSDAMQREKYKLPINYGKLNPTQRRQVREQYVVEQKGICPFCKSPLSGPAKNNYNLDMRLFPKHFLNYPIHLHHDHQTGLTIGAYHAHCNGVLWQYFGE